MLGHRVIVWVCLLIMTAIKSSEARPQILEAIGDGIGSIFEGIGEGIGDAFEGIGEFFESVNRPSNTIPPIPLGPAPSGGVGIPRPPPTSFQQGPAPTFQQGLDPTFQQGFAPAPTIRQGLAPAPTFQQGLDNIVGVRVEA